MARTAKVPQAALDIARRIRAACPDLAWAKISKAVDVSPSVLAYHLAGDRVDTVHEVAQSICRGARKRAKNDADIKVTRDFSPVNVVRAIEAQGSCYLSGRQFNYQRKHPDRPSPDRINPRGPYSFQNVRFSTVGVNLARRDLSVEAFQDMCRDVAKTAWEDPS